MWRWTWWSTSPSSNSPDEERRVLLALRDVGKAWHIARTGERVPALQAITLDVAAGEFLILLGPSGCGKSTLLQIMAGLETPSSGAIDFPAAAGERSKLTSMVFQEYARRLIELVNLRGAETRYPHELSGGMRQRVALARALANDPQILLFDEPLAALDAQTRRVLQDELLRIWKETGKTFVYVTHSLQEAVLLGSRIVLMTAGPGRIKRIVEVPLARPRHVTGRAEAEMLDQLDVLLGEEVTRAMAL